MSRKGKRKVNGFKETRGTIPNKEMIKERPQEANERRSKQSSMVD